MAISLTRDEMAERLEQRRERFVEAMTTKWKPKRPIIFYSSEDLFEFASDALSVVLDVVFEES